MTTRERLLAAGLTEDQVQVIARYCPWNRDRLAEEVRHEGWEAAMLRDSEATRAFDLAARATGHLRLLLGDGPSALANHSVAELAALCSKGSLRDLCHRYDPTQHGGRLVCGPTGVGKTAAGVAVVRRICAEPYAQWAIDREFEDPLRRRTNAIVCHWARAQDLPNSRLHAALGNGEAEEVESAKDCDFLVLDELAWESKRASADDVILEVIAARYDSGKPTYATTGLKLEQFTERYGDAVIRKLIQAGGKPGKVLDLWPR